jgi:hypothetical protein
MQTLTRTATPTLAQAQRADAFTPKVSVAPTPRVGNAQSDAEASLAQATRGLVDVFGQLLTHALKDPRGEINLGLLNPNNQLQTLGRIMAKTQVLTDNVSAVDLAATLNWAGLSDETPIPLVTINLRQFIPHLTLDADPVLEASTIVSDHSGNSAKSSLSISKANPPSLYQVAEKTTVGDWNTSAIAHDEVNTFTSDGAKQRIALLFSDTNALMPQYLTPPKEALSPEAMTALAQGYEALLAALSNKQSPIGLS